MQIIEQQINSNSGSCGRYEYIDWAKTLLICFMCIGHSNAHDMIKTFIYVFHMPAFFIISGYLYKPQAIRKRTLSLLVPVLFFGFFNCLFECVVDYVNGGSFFNLKWLKFYSFFPGFWFIVTLYLIYLISGIASRVHEKFILSIGFGAFVLSVLIETFWGFEFVKTYRGLYYLVNLLTCLPFFTIGIFLKNRMPIKFNICHMLIASALSLILTCVQGRSDLGELVFNYSYVLFAINAIISSLIFFYICSLLKSNRWVLNFSVGTLVILGIHRIVISAIYILTKKSVYSWVVAIFFYCVFGILFNIVY